MNGKHTPRPWAGFEVEVVSVGLDRSVDARAVEREGRECGEDCVAFVPLKSDALLIAAAPDLLDALKCARVHVARYLDEVGPCDHSVNICVCGIKETIDQVDAAIAKAEGEKEKEAAP